MSRRRGECECDWCRIIFEEMMAENFPNMIKDIHLQIQEAKRIPNWINSKETMPRHILIKLLKTMFKKKKS